MSSKQKTLQAALAIRGVAAVSAALWISCIAPAADLARAQDRKLPPTRGDQVAKVRLIAAPGLSDGRYDAGIDISMSPGSHTYWKQPGDAGVPPVFAFNGSTNVADAKVLFPTPKRIDEDGIQAFGYLDKVVFPVVVTPREAGKPAELSLVVDYAVCNKICIPAHATAKLTLTPDGSGVDGDVVAKAFAAAPLPLDPADAAKLTLTPDKGTAKPTWTVTWSGATPVEDIFAVAPEGFYFDTRRLGPNRFSLRAVQVVSATGATQVPVKLTLARATGSVVASETLDIAASHP